MLLRNLDVPILFNGSIFVAKNVMHLLEAAILAEGVNGEDVFIPRIHLIPTDVTIS